MRKEELDLAKEFVFLKDNGRTLAMCVPIDEKLCLKIIRISHVTNVTAPTQLCTATQKFVRAVSPFRLDSLELTKLPLFVRSFPYFRTCGFNACINVYEVW